MSRLSEKSEDIVRSTLSEIILFLLFFFLILLASVIGLVSVPTPTTTGEALTPSEVTEGQADQEAVSAPEPVEGMSKADLARLLGVDPSNLGDGAAALGRIGATLDGLRGQIGEGEARRGELEAENKRQKDRAEAAEAERDRQSAEADQLAGRLERSEEERREADERRADEAGRADELAGEVARLENELDELHGKLEDESDRAAAAEDKNAALDRDLDKARAERDRYKKRLARKAALDQPAAPIVITIDATEEATFKSGTADIGLDFSQLLDREIAGMREIIEARGIEYIDVIGHTDGEVVGEGKVALGSNLDTVLLLQLDVSDGARATRSDLRFVDNVGLGMARAVAVTNYLRLALADMAIEILPYSAGQAITPADQIADVAENGKDETRRRIEIRLRRKSEKPAGQ